MASSALNTVTGNPLLRLASRLLVSIIVAFPFLLAGGYGVLEPDFPKLVAMVVLILGAGLLCLGLYMSLAGVAPTPALVSGERQIIQRHPTMKPAYARMIWSIPFIVAAGYLLQFTQQPYIFPFVPFVIGMYFFLKGVMKYLRNLHITYTITDRRVMHMYKFLWLSTKEIPVARIVSISETRSFFEILTGRGTVVVATGIGQQQVIRIEEINDPSPVALALREMMPTT
uniref:Putative bacterial membrane flanked domain protein n=1 Tax=uncultured marine microorganism HF4000_010I05 TaxID=455517 RepID=B3T1J7_9ZZZZ|nr:putative bacterial membrane flanked domain protein [uncultured marine microorganism HF4000_010I05]